MTELKLTELCAKAFNKNFPLHRTRLFRIKNELDNHPRKSPLDRAKQLSENQATGVRAGIADFVLIDNNGKSNWIELKLEDGVQSQEQKIFEAMVNSYKIVRNVQDFLQYCTECLT